MRPLAVVITSLTLLGPASGMTDPATDARRPGWGAALNGAGPPVVVVQRNSSAPSARGPAAKFIGNVRIDMPFRADPPARVSGGTITFEPGARTAWYTHPLGQTLIVTAGVGWVQQWGGPVEEIRPGDVVRTPPGAKHWHGATATTGMTHLAVSEQLDGRCVDWMEKVSDDQYQLDRDSLQSTSRPQQ